MPPDELACICMPELSDMVVVVVDFQENSLEERAVLVGHILFRFDGCSSDPITGIWPVLVVLQTPDMDESSCSGGSRDYFESCFDPETILSLKPEGIR